MVLHLNCTALSQSKSSNFLMCIIINVTEQHGSYTLLPFTIVNRGEWLWNPANIKGANKDTKIYVGRSTTVHNRLFCSHTLCMNYVTNTFLLVSSSVRSKQLLCFVHGQGQKREQKHTTKNFDEFHNHSPLLTMLLLTNTKAIPTNRDLKCMHLLTTKVSVE